MSLWQQVGDWYDQTTENVTEWWGGEAEKTAAENSGIPNSESNPNVAQPKKAINWTAAGVFVTGASILVSLLK